MCEQVTVEGGVLLQQGLEVQGPFGGDELVQAHLVRSDRRPLLLHVPVIWVWADIPDALENHCDTLNHTATSYSTLHRYDLAMTETASPAPVEQSEQSAEVAEIVAGYTFDEPAIDLGVLMEDDVPVPSAIVRIPLSMLNRHGLVAGATGTGKTKTLQLMAEQISAAGVPVFAADIKGDLSGIASPGQPNDKLLARTQKIGQDWQPKGCPTEFFALGGQGFGIPLRATMSSFGPVLLSKVLGLNEVQESSLGLVFHYADQAGLPLLDLKDLRAVLTHLTSDEGKAELKAIGGLSAATAGVILRTLITFSDQGADEFFGEPEFDTADLLRVTRDGQGVVSLLELPNLVERPTVFSTFLMWLLADLFHELPEVGDIDKPKLVFFFDEAHLLFDDASKAFLDAIAQTVRLIRSKGVGIFFVTQTPKDVPDDVLAQLGSRVQHQLRAHTPNDAKALKQTVATFPRSHYDLAETLQQLGIGEGIVTVMDPDGAPTPVAWTRMRAPESLMAPTPEEVLRPGIAASGLMAKYGQDIDRDSAHEMLARKLAAGAEAAERERQAQLTEEDAKRQAKIEAEARTMAEREMREAERAERAGSRTRSSTRREKSMVEEIAGSSAFRQFARTAGREIVRSIFGTARRRR